MTPGVGIMKETAGNDHKIESRVIGKIFLAEVFAGCGFI